MLPEGSIFNPEGTVFHYTDRPQATRQITCFFFPAVNGPKNGFVRASWSLNRLAYRLKDIRKKLTSERVSKSVAESEKIRDVYSTEIHSNTATFREVNSTEIDSYFG